MVLKGKGKYTNGIETKVAEVGNIVTSFNGEDRSWINDGNEDLVFLAVKLKKV